MTETGVTRWRAITVGLAAGAAGGLTGGQSEARTLRSAGSRRRVDVVVVAQASPV
jgi:hypothetical protein